MMRKNKSMIINTDEAEEMTHRDQENNEKAEALVEHFHC